MRWPLSIPRSIVLSAGAALLAVSLASADPSTVIYSTEGNRLRRYDVDTIDNPPLVEDILIQRASAAESGGGAPVGSFRDLNGLVCLFPDGSGRFVAGEDTGQPSPPAGWGVFTPGGEQIGKLTATYLVPQAEPFGCAFDSNGILFTTEVGEQGFENPSGQLIMWFPPYAEFPGPEGVYPNTDEPSANFCKIATDIGTAGSLAIDSQGRVYVASASQLSVFRFSPPFPTSPDLNGGCGSTDALGSPMADVVNRDTFISPTGLSTFSGLAFATNDNLYASSVLTGQIFEFDPNGSLVRMILDPNDITLPIPTGSPQSVALGKDGTLYYADLNLVGTLPAVGPGSNGKVWRIRFDEFDNPLPPELIRQNLAFPDGVSVLPGDLEPPEWRTYAGGKSRHFFNPAESSITAANVGQLEVKWSFPTDAIITGSPSVARVLVPGEGRIPVAYILSWDANVYAIRVRDGSELWRFETDTHPGASFPHAGSTHVEEVNGTETVYIGSGETFYALDAVTGQEVWRFDAGTGCQNPPGLCAFDGERNEIESSPIVVDGKVIFGMDVNDSVGGKGGVYALDAEDGRLVWFFDLESGSACMPLPGDDIRRFDGYHSELELGLPSDFLSTRPGCDFPRSPNGCGNVWSSPAADEDRELIYVASSNCDTDDDPNTLKPPAPMPPYDEAIFALGFDGTPAWVWRPREVDNADLAFGAVPNLFTAKIGGVEREVIGIGNKDGTYYLLDRDGENEITGVRWDDADPNDLPYWRTNVVPGGPTGGILATAAVDEASGRIYFGTAPGSFADVFNPQRPTVHALDAATGAILWENTAEPDADATFSPTSAVPGVVFTGSVVGGFLRPYDATNGDKVGSTIVGLALASAPAVIDGLVILGGGVGSRNGDPNSSSEISSRTPHDLTALCVPGTRACALDEPISGKKIQLQDKDGKPGKRKFKADSRDSGISAPAIAGEADPTVEGALLQLINPISGEEQKIVLPASGWSGKGGPPGSKGYLYRDSKLERGPCKKVLVQSGRILIICKGDGLELTLDEPQQEAFAVGLTLGNSVTYCMRFGGSVISDVPAQAGKTGKFIAKDAATPVSCPLP